MKNLLKIVLPAIAIPFLATSVAMSDSHDKKDPSQHMDKMVEHMAIDLELTDEQKTKIRALMKEEHEKMKALHDEKDAQMKLILTEEQYEKMEEMRPHHGGPHGEKPHCKMKKGDNSEDKS